MIKFKRLSLKNFLSIGNVVQTIDFTNYDLTLILGENRDLEGSGHRNGTGKSTILNGLFFAIHGIPLVSIKKDHLINDVNLKGMEVVLEYEVDNKSFRIERGRKPNYLRYYVNNGLLTSPINDEAAGESKWTQVEIERDLGNLSHILSKYIILLHTKTIPFLSLREKDQRELIEELLSIAQLSQKAEILKDQIKQVRDEIQGEEIRIRTTIDSNDKIRKHITDLRLKSSLWDKNQTSKIEQLQNNLLSLNHIDIQLEIQAHKDDEIWNKINAKIKPLQAECYHNESSLEKISRDKNLLLKQLEKLAQHSCHACGQIIHDDKVKQLRLDIEHRQITLFNEEQTINLGMDRLAVDLENVLQELNTVSKPENRIYKTLEQALNHRHKIDTLAIDISREQKTENPLIDQIATLTTSAIQSISYEYVNELTNLKEHQEFLYKMLTSKESFIRKKIIDQNLSYLNRNLNLYLQQLNLPHEVVFKSDLSVDITKFGKDYDYDQLSTGQSNRLILAIAWAFRDTWEGMNHSVNLLMIDEVIDNGLDEQGTAASIDILRNMAKDKRKNIFLISHKEGLEDKVDDVFMVHMENGFTSFGETIS